MWQISYPPANGASLGCFFICYLPDPYWLSLQGDEETGSIGLKNKLRVGTYLTLIEHQSFYFGEQDWVKEVSGSKH